MSDRLPAVKPKELITALERRGWQLDRIRGSHHILVHPELRRAVTVPVHTRELKRGTLSAILRSADISRAELADLLD
ncbi:MAG: type II toxin-antitoxin system HicA family toxin [Chloroflexota bacterium]|nr:type II toxin-antitoxin system HicA family toxin [Chloroflexota bacterium]